VAVASDGHVWIGGQLGLFVGDEHRFDAIDPSRGGFSFGGIARVVTDVRGGVWVVTPRGVVHGEPAR
jgi:ligand-binding sensor domain-containing protein